MKPVLKYPGAKQRIADWVISFFPEHHSYVEPYAGSLAVLLNKTPSRIETVNDLDGDVVNLFKIIRDNPEPLIRAVALTPYSRQEYSDCFTMQSGNSKIDEVEKARIFLVKCWQSHGFRQNNYKVGWRNDIAGREYAYAVKDWNRLPGNIAAVVERLKEVQIENRPAVEVIKRLNRSNVLIYADPPYLLSTRHGKNYKHEMTDEDHVELLKALLQHKGPVILSGYDNEIYNDYLSTWHKEQIGTFASHAKRRTEILWMNFQPELKFC